MWKLITNANCVREDVDAAEHLVPRIGRKPYVFGCHVSSFQVSGMNL